MSHGYIAAWRESRDELRGDDGDWTRVYARGGTSVRYSRRPSGYIDVRRAGKSLSRNPGIIRVFASYIFR